MLCHLLVPVCCLVQHCEVPPATAVGAERVVLSIIDSSFAMDGTRSVAVNRPLKNEVLTGEIIMNTARTYLDVEFLLMVVLE
jgi:hypothetical protein